MCIRTSSQLTEREEIIPLLSIIVPVFNTYSYIEMLVDSIVFQSFDNYELILIDDGSTDGSAKICEKLAMDNEHVRVAHQANAGVSAARNSGMAIARGRYLWFCDSDDQVAPDALDKIAKILEAKHPGVLIFEVEQIDEYGNKLGLIPEPRPSTTQEEGPLQCGDLLYPFAHVFRRELAEGLTFDTSLALLEDRDFFYRICLKAAGDTAVIREPLYRYLITREGSAVNSSSADKYIAATRVQELILKSEKERGFPSPAYEFFVEFSLGALSRAYRYGATPDGIDSVLERLRRHWNDRSLLSGKQRIKLSLAVCAPRVYRLLALLTKSHADTELGASVVFKESRAHNCSAE